MRWRLQERRWRLQERRRVLLCEPTHRDTNHAKFWPSRHELGLHPEGQELGVHPEGQELGLHPEGQELGVGRGVGGRVGRKAFPRYRYHHTMGENNTEFHFGTQADTSRGAAGHVKWSREAMRMRLMV